MNLSSESDLGPANVHQPEQPEHPEQPESSAAEDASLAPDDDGETPGGKEGDVGNTREKEGREEGSSSEKRGTSLNEVLNQWLSSLRINGLAKGLNVLSESSEGSLPQFSDGLLLAKIVESLEMKRIEGLTMAPKRPAHSLHNIKKSLEVLAANKRMPVRYLFSAAEVHAGEKDNILGLLEHARRAYGHHLRPLSGKARAGASAGPGTCNKIIPLTSRGTNIPSS